MKDLDISPKIGRGSYSPDPKLQAPYSSFSPNAADENRYNEVSYGIPCDIVLRENILFLNMLLCV